MDVFSLIKVSKCRNNLSCFSELFAARKPARLGVPQDQSTMREEHKCEGRMPCGLGARGGLGGGDLQSLSSSHDCHLAFRWTDRL